VLQTARRVIYTGDLTVEAENPVAAARALTDIVTKWGGYVANSDIREQQGSVVATISFRVPSERYQSALNEIMLASDKVRAQKTGSQDVSEEFADLQAQLRNLRATEAQFVELLKRAKSERHNRGLHAAPPNHAAVVGETRDPPARVPDARRERSRAGELLQPAAPPGWTVTLLRLLSCCGSGGRGAARKASRRSTAAATRTTATSRRTRARCRSR
jgi:hypothetical protein